MYFIIQIFFPKSLNPLLLGITNGEGVCVFYQNEIGDPILVKFHGLLKCYCHTIIFAVRNFKILLKCASSFQFSKIIIQKIAYFAEICSIIMIFYNLSFLNFMIYHRVFTYVWTQPVQGTSIADVQFFRWLVGQVKRDKMGQGGLVG